MEHLNMAELIADGSEVLHELERRINAVVGILTSGVRAGKPDTWHHDGLSVNCPGKKLLWIFDPRFDREEVRLWTLETSGEVDDLLYKQGKGMAAQNIEAAYEVLELLVLGMLKEFPELGKKVAPYLGAATRKVA